MTDIVEIAGDVIEDGYSGVPTGIPRRIAASMAKNSMMPVSHKLSSRRGANSMMRSIYIEIESVTSQHLDCTLKIRSISQFVF